jgi:hypothetical protein
MDWGQLLSPAVVAAVVLAVTAMKLFQERLGLVLDAVTALLLSWIKKRRESGDCYNLGFQAGQRCYEMQDRMVLCPYVGRLLMFNARNCKGEPKIGHRCTVCCTIGWQSQEKDDPKVRQDPKSLYDSPFIVDDHYIGLLIRLKAEKVIDVLTADLPKCLIGSLYRLEGVVFAQWFYLQTDEDDGTMTYASVGSYVRPFTDDEKMSLGVAMERVKSTYRFANAPGSSFEMPRLP